MTFPKRGTRWFMSRVGAAMLALGGAAGCGHGGESDDAAAPPALPVVNVGTTTAQVASFAPTIRAIGTVSATAGGYAELSAPAPTRVTRVFVAVGQPVRAGDPLVALDAAALSATARGALAAREAAQHAYERAAGLAAEGIVARKAVDQAAADLAQANAAAVGAQHTLALATLRAPFSGVVTRLSAVTGGAADPAQVLVAIANPAALAVVMQLSPDDAAAVRPGAAVTLYERDTPDAASIGTGAVATIGAAIDTATRAVPVRIRPGPTMRPLRLGETVVGRIATTATARGVSVPLGALVPDTAGSFRVFVVRGGIARSVPVTIGARSDSTAQVTHGVAAGDVVVTTGAYGIEDSARVRSAGH